ncbi:MAG: hypothetical protein ACTJFR_06545 [Canibacter sp.]
MNVLWAAAVSTFTFVVSSIAQLVDETETEVNPDDVTPGWEGFAFTGLFVAAVIVLGFLLVRTIRRIQYRSEIQENLQEEKARLEGQTDDDAGPSESSDQ